MNPVSHRDCSSVVGTYIQVHPDRVETSNPRILPPGWTEENPLKSHLSKPANPKIADIFYDMGHIGQFGGGVKMICDECEAMNLPLLEYLVDDDIITPIFRLPEKKDECVSGKVTVDMSGMTETESKVYSRMCAGDVSTRRALVVLALAPPRHLIPLKPDMTQGHGAAAALSRPGMLREYRWGTVKNNQRPAVFINLCYGCRKHVRLPSSFFLCLCASGHSSIIFAENPSTCR